MRINRFAHAICLFLFALTSRSYAQQRAMGSCDVPLVVTNFDNVLVKDLGPQDLLVRLGAVPITFESISIDGGPKRVALILDPSENVPEDEWKLEIEMGFKFVGHARPDDKFLFLLVGTEVSTGAYLSPTEVEEQLRKLATTRPPNPDSSERIYDALIAGAKRLDPSNFGDVLFLFGHHEDVGSKADPDQLLEVILKNKLRFFGVSFADPLRGKVPRNFDPNKPLPASLGPTTLEKMSSATGNYFSFHSVQVLNRPGQTPLFEGFLEDLYARVAEPYRLQIPMSSVNGQTKLEISVINMNDRNVRTSGIYYPRFIYPCAPPKSGPL
jgi:hypothetical protein